MKLLWILFGAAALLALVVLGICYYCFRVAFYAPRNQKHDPEKPDTPVGDIYDPYRADMERWILEARAMPQEHFSIESFDGLKLHGTFYEYAPGAPVELMFHGYRGTAERDLSGGVQRCFRLGRSALIVDQRCSGRSGGNVITFGIREHKDCLAWARFAAAHFGPDVKIILTGISMGAATVMMAAGEALPEQVIGVLADCGYSSPKAIILEVLKQMKLPPKLCYPFVKLAARIYGYFDLEENSPEEALKRAKVPVIFFHGEADDFVPCHMSRTCYDACVSRKMLITVPGAGHGLSYPMDTQGYLTAVKRFFDV